MRPQKLILLFLLLGSSLWHLTGCNNAQKNVLVVAPHPDDETLGPGGQVALLVQEGYSIHIIVLTDGSQLFVAQFGTESDPPPSEISNRRKRETERTVAHLGANPQNIRYIDIQDGNLSHKVDYAADIVASAIRELNPVQVYVSSGFEIHPDHRAANTVVKQAYTQLTGNKPDLWEYCVGPGPDFGPGDGPESLLEIDISPVYDRKAEAIGMFDCHLEITVKGQTEPLWEDGSQYLAKTERFLFTPGAKVLD